MASPGESRSSVRPFDPQARAAAVTALLNPSSIALIGASDRSRWSTTAFDNLSQGGFEGAIHLVNPRGAPAHGRTVATSCAAIGLPIDLGLVMAPSSAVPDAIADLAAAGARSAVILSAGFSETGAAGRQLQERLRAVAAQHQVRLLGPNCLGFINFVNRAFVWTTPIGVPTRNTGVAIVSQSGATAFFLSQLAQQQDVGLSHVVSTGNEVDLDSASFIEYLVEDPHARAIAVFAETFRDPAGFLRAARRAQQVGKPLVVLKVGASVATAKAALAHTGALVGDDRIFEGVCQQFGIIRARSMEELLTTADIVGRVGVLRPGGLCVMTNSGGVGEIAADTAALHGIGLPELSPATLARLQAMLPDAATAHNPLDLTGAVSPEQCEDALRVLASQPEVAAILCPWYAIPTESGQISERLTQSHHHLTRGLAAAPVPGLLVSYTGTSVNALARETIARTGANYLACGLDRALAGLAGAFWWSERQRAHANRLHLNSDGDDDVPQDAATRPRSEHEALAFLLRHGVPVVPMHIAIGPEQAVHAARTLGGSVVLKVASPDIAHKSDIGAVLLNLRGDDAVRDAFTRIMDTSRKHHPTAHIDGVLVAPMRGRGIELFVGFSRDPQWGAVLAVGLGGIWVEILQDVALRLLPVDTHEVKRMLLGLRGAKLLAGSRGMPAADLDAVAGAIARIGDAVMRLGPELDQADVNPLWVCGAQVEALDALLVWKDSAVVATARHADRTPQTI
jgi:acetate---CoA ligase (ADP-forming)